MIGTSFPGEGSRPRRLRTEREENIWSHSPLAPSSAQARFAASNCDYTLTLSGSDTLTDCPSCGGKEFVRASLFSNTERIEQRRDRAARRGAVHSPPSRAATSAWRAPASASTSPASTSATRRAATLRTVALTREWTRIGRSLAADVRFDDPTVSRRHALIVRHADGVRLLDDRSLNGVFVNGARVDGQALQDGDEIIVGRYRLLFVSVPADAESAPARAGPASIQSLG